VVAAIELHPFDDVEFGYESAASRRLRDNAAAAIADCRTVGGTEK
jgi:hypothetical protein